MCGKRQPWSEFTRFFFVLLSRSRFYLVLRSVGLTDVGWWKLAFARNNVETQNELMCATSAFASLTSALNFMYSPEKTWNHIQWNASFCFVFIFCSLLRYCVRAIRWLHSICNKICKRSAYSHPISRISVHSDGGSVTLEHGNSLVCLFVFICLSTPSNNCAVVVGNELIIIN